jgi:AcrR family transcriptional regulator
MARRAPEQRFQDLVDAATGVFIAQGYRRTQIADVAAAMGVAKGTVYLYVASKEALFDLALRCAGAPRPTPAPATLPVPTPRPGSTLRYVRERLAEHPAGRRIAEALARRRVEDPRGELDAVVRELYRSTSAHRVALKLVDRCAAEYPSLARVWFGEGREGLLHLLGRYLEARVSGGHFRTVPDLAVASRLVVETVVFWAVHRHWDPSPQAVDERAAEDTVARMLVNSLVRESPQ